MGKRMSQVILLCEDDPQERLVRCYLEQCGFNTAAPYLRPINASRMVHGGNVQWVLREFPNQLQAWRKRHAAFANTLLIVVADADEFAVKDRERQFWEVPMESNTDDPLVILIPRRHVETWIRSALGDAVNETDGYKTPKPRKSEIRLAAQRIHAWCHSQEEPVPGCVQSLRAALPLWRRIG